MNEYDILTLKENLQIVADQKQFTINPKDVTITETAEKAAPKRTPADARRRRRTRTTAKTTTTKRPAIAHTTDFAKLLHSTIIDLEELAQPLPHTGERYEAPLKYLSLWGSQRVNINTAPRHVLEAAFSFGGDPQELAAAIIEQRRKKPFKDVAELRRILYQYSDAIKKAEPYITAKSSFFSVKVAAVSGNAKASAVGTVTKSGKKVQKIAIMAY